MYNLFSIFNYIISNRPSLEIYNNYLNTKLELLIDIK